MEISFNPLSSRLSILALAFVVPAHRGQIVGLRGHKAIGERVFHTHLDPDRSGSGTFLAGGLCTRTS
jgi:hypothetical protein